MIPNLEDYDTNDPRQIILYSWHFELFAVKESIEFTKKGLDDKVSHLIRLAQENLMNPIYCDAMIKVQEYHNVEPIAYQSYLLTLYAIVEASLDRYCKICEEKMNLKVKLEDFKDKGITRAVNYLEKCVEVDNIKSDIKWGRMQLINDMRNDFIHRAGYSDKLNKIKKYEAELKICTEDGKIYLLYEDIIRMYEYIEQFMEFAFSREFTNPNKTLIKKS
ncbi:MAG: hypothetical protein E6370_16495 [Clostridiales bacterium]|jgi:hypothetical protein|nr:hypothetical protein [Clostridiales bacterium]